MLYPILASYSLFYMYSQILFIGQFTSKQTENTCFNSIRLLTYSLFSVTFNCLLLRNAFSSLVVVLERLFVEIISSTFRTSSSEAIFLPFSYLLRDV